MTVVHLYSVKSGSAQTETYPSISNGGYKFVKHEEKNVKVTLKSQKKQILYNRKKLL